MYLQANSTTNYTASRDFYSDPTNKKIAYIRKECSSDIVISDESGVNGGYKIYAWYTSGTGTTSNAYKGSAMIKKTYISQDSQLGSELFEIGGYNAFSGLSATGSKAWVKHTGGGISTKGGGKQYTRDVTKKPLPERIKNADKQYISLTDSEKTLVILYVREHGSIDSSSSTEPKDPPNDPYQELTIVKCYGVINPITYEVVEDKTHQVWTSKTRNVHITNESGYRLAEYVYCTKGSNASSMTAAKWCKPLSPPNTLPSVIEAVESSNNKSFYLKGFVDRFSIAPENGGYSNQYAWTESALNSTTSGNTITGNTDYPGTKGKGRLSGKSLNGYNKTIYFGPDSMVDSGNSSTTDDVLYILFLKEDEVSYETGTFGIPESYLTRWNNFATNNIKVTGNFSGSNKTYSFAQHQFKCCQKPTIYITSI